MNIRSSATMKQFFLSLIATTISIILTFGTSAIIENRQKEKAKREMVLMIIYDFDKTIEQVQHADSLLQQASKAQQEVALHPECFDSQRPRFISAISIITDNRFAETTEKIFSSNIETFNTLGNVNFVHEVSAFYNSRRYYQENVLDEFEKEVVGTGIVESLESLFKVDFPIHYITNKECLVEMQKIRNRCMQMMKISEDELEKFSDQRLTDESNNEVDDDKQQMLEKFFEEEENLRQAIEKLEQNQ